MIDQQIERRKDKCVQSNPRFDEAVGTKGASKFVRFTAQERIAKCEASHEDRQYHRLSLNSAPEHLREILRPDNFIDERGSTRKKEQSRDSPSPGLSRIHSAR